MTQAEIHSQPARIALRPCVRCVLPFLAAALLGKDLQVMASSEPFVNNVLCLSQAGWTSAKSKSYTAEDLADLHLDPAGQQILTLFKVGPMVPFQETQLATIKKLRATHEQLQKTEHNL